MDGQSIGPGEEPGNRPIYIAKLLYQLMAPQTALVIEYPYKLYTNPSKQAQNATQGQIEGFLHC
jgi:hypothetical protein